MTTEADSKASSRPTVLADSSWDDLPMAKDRSVGWKVMRDAGPVVVMDDWYYLTQREDVLFALRNPDVFSSARIYDNLGSPFPLIPLGIDPPEHTRYRQILQPFFSPKALGSLLPSLQQQSVELIDRVAQGGECEAVREIAIPYPSQVFLTLFGLPLEDRDRLIHWKDVSIGLSDNPQPSEADLTSMMEFLGYLKEAVDSKRAQPGDDILSKLLVGDDALDDNEAFGLCFLFVLAGLDTVTASLGFSLYALAQDPELRAALVADPDQIRVFVEDAVRLEPPAPILQRMTTQDIEIGGTTIPKDAQVRVCLGAVGRDGTDAVSEEKYVLDGKVHPHWGFGGGAHRCLGSHLARMELTLIVGEWLKRVPEFSVKPGVQPEIEWPSPTFGLKELPLVW